MILYVDETENNEYFVVTGLLAKDRFSVEMAYKHFKNRIINYPIKNKSKELVYREFKSITLDKHYQRIKNIMLEEINLIDNHFIIYSVYVKKEEHLVQQIKEDIYIKLISKIAEKCGEVSIVYDCFNNPKFEAKINKELKKMINVNVVVAKDSQEEPGLQFADNLCSVIRLHISQQDKYNFYEKISSNYA